MDRKINYIIQTKKYRVREYKNNRERTVGYFSTLDEAKICQAGHHWITGLTPDPSRYFGFIYLIEDNLTGMKYIGKKQYYFYNKEGGPSSNNITSPNFNKASWVESDWRYYTSSSKILVPIIAERYNDFYFEILKECKSKVELLTEEIYWQQFYDVLNATLPNGDRGYYNQNIEGCDFNIHDSGEVARSVRYNPLYQAWSKAMMSMDVCKAWKDPKVFIKDNEKSVKGFTRPVISRLDGQPLSPWNIQLSDDKGVVHSENYDGVEKDGNLWVGRIHLPLVSYEVRGISERHVAAEMDDLIDKEGLSMEKQLKWV